MSNRARLAGALATLFLLALPAVAHADGYRIDVGVQGNGIVAGNGFNCGPGIPEPECSIGGFVSLNGIALAAAPAADPGWRFSHWSLSGNVTTCDGDDGSFANPCGFTLPFTCLCPRVQSVTAVFVRENHPVTTLDPAAGPAAGSTVGPGTRSFSYGAEAGATFKCRAYRTSEVPPALGSCSSPSPVNATTHGEWKFEVRAVDTFGSHGPLVSRTWNVDATAPVTDLSNHPPVEAIGPNARFDFSSPDATAQFQCKLDGGGWAGCASPRILTPGEGPHTFQVRAYDPYGNIDDTPQSWSWEQEIPPLTTFGEGPQNGERTNSPSERFSFSANEPAQGFECRLDGGGWAPCTSPVDLSGLADGSHTFHVRARDLRLNVELTPPSRTWTVDTTPPQTTITEGPSEGSKTSETGARFDFVSEAGARFECSLDGEAFAVCPRGPDGRVTVDGLAVGEHKFRVRAIDQAGNADFTPAQRSWTVVADGDADGYNRDKDCRDDDPAIHPGAHDVPENGVDEDCDGADAINFDRDGDGAKRPLDCDDNDPARRPGAPEIPANGVDEDCDGADADFPVVSAGITYQWFYKGAKAWPKLLKVTKVQVGSTVKVTCKGKKKACPFAVKQIAGTGKDLDLAKLFGGKKLRRGAKLKIEVTAPGMTRKIVKFKVRKGKAPSGGKFACRRPGATTTVACPA